MVTSQHLIMHQTRHTERDTERTWDTSAIIEVKIDVALDAILWQSDTILAVRTTSFTESRVVIVARVAELAGCAIGTDLAIGDVTDGTG